MPPSDRDSVNPTTALTPRATPAADSDTHQGSLFESSGNARTPDLSSPRRNLLVIYNPTAGQRRRTRFRKTLQALSVHGATVTVRETGGAGDAGILATQAWRNHDAVVVAGGDGTINEVAAALVGIPVAIGIIPIGTANVLARELGLGGRATDIARAILEGPVVSSRVAELKSAEITHRFLMMAGAGFDARVVDGVDSNLKRKLGKAAYLWSAVRQLSRYRSPALKVTIDGDGFDASAVIVANGQRYAGRFVIAPRARLDAHSLEVVLFERPGRWHLIRYVFALLTGRIDRLAGISIVTGRKIGIEGGSDEPVQADGDAVARLPVQIELLKSRLTLIGPAKNN